MNIDKISNNSFGAIKYLKAPLENPNSIVNPKAISALIDGKPAFDLKKIVENSDFFKALGKETDVFISTQRTSHKRTLFHELTAIFFDPSSKKATPDEFNIKLESPNELVFYDKLDAVLSNLPEKYSSLKEKYQNINNRLILGPKNSNWFIIQGK